MSKQKNLFIFLLWASLIISLAENRSLGVPPFGFGECHLYKTLWLEGRRTDFLKSRAYIIVSVFMEVFFVKNAHIPKIFVKMLAYFVKIFKISVKLSTENRSIGLHF